MHALSPPKVSHYIFLEDSGSFTTVRFVQQVRLSAPKISIGYWIITFIPPPQGSLCFASKISKLIRNNQAGSLPSSWYSKYDFRLPIFQRGNDGPCWISKISTSYWMITRMYSLLYIWSSPPKFQRRTEVSARLGYY